MKTPRSLSKIIFFTLIELLICIAIIAMLAALLIPALSKAKASAKSIKCIGNQKQCGLAFLQYASDNSDWLIGCQYGSRWNRIMMRDGYLPYPPEDSDSEYDSEYTYRGDVVYRCPDSPLPEGPLLGVAYGAVSTYSSTNNSFNPVKLSSVSKPSARIWVADSYNTTNTSSTSNAQSFMFSGNFDIYEQASGLILIHTRHNNKAGIWCLDGHAIAENAHGLNNYSKVSWFYYVYFSNKTKSSRLPY